MGTRETFRSRFLGGSPGPGPPSGVPSPSGQNELYGGRVPSSNPEFYPVPRQVLTCETDLVPVGRMWLVVSAWDAG